MAERTSTREVLTEHAALDLTGPASDLAVMCRCDLTYRSSAAHHAHVAVHFENARAQDLEPLREQAVEWRDQMSSGVKIHCGRRVAGSARRAGRQPVTNRASWRAAQVVAWCVAVATLAALASVYGTGAAALGGVAVLAMACQIAAGEAAG